MDYIYCGCDLKGPGETWKYMVTVWGRVGECRVAAEWEAGFDWNSRAVPVSTQSSLHGPFWAL